MGLRMFLLLSLVMIVFTVHSQGVPDTHEQSLIITDASDVREPQITAEIKRTPKPHTGLSHREEKESKIVRRLSQQPTSRRCRKIRALCQKKENENRRICRLFSKQQKRCNKQSFGPSVPI